MPSSPAARSSAKRFEMRVGLAATAFIIWTRLKETFVGVHVLIAAAGKIEDDQVVFGKLRQALDEAGDGVRGFERRDDALSQGEQFCGFERGGIGDRYVVSAVLIGEPSVLGTDSWIIEASGNGMRGSDLAVLVLQNVGVRSLQDAGARASKTLFRA